MKSRPDSAECGRHAEHAVAQPSKSALLKRLTRIEGQTRGLAKIVGEDRYCVDVPMQISAIQSALDALALQLLANHTKGCVRSAVRCGNGKAAIGELMIAVKRFGPWR